MEGSVAKELPLILAPMPSGRGLNEAEGPLGLLLGRQAPHGCVVKAMERQYASARDLVCWLLI